MIEWISKQTASDKRHQLEFVGHVTRQEVISLYRQATVVAFPSLWEPFGYVCTEAMACAKPVITTRSGGPEEIIDDGRTGFLVPPGDPASLAEKISAVLGDESRLRTVGQAAREKAVAVYDSSVISRQVSDFYRSVIGGR